MRARLAEIRWEDLAMSAGSVGVFAVLVAALEHLDRAAVEMRSAILVILAAVLAVVASTIDGSTAVEAESQEERARWCESDASLRGM